MDAGDRNNTGLVLMLTDTARCSVVSFSQ